MQMVTNGLAVESTGADYLFKGNSYWQSNTDYVDLEKTTTGVWNDTQYARLTAAPTKVHTGLLDVWVYPKTIGERGAHRFHFTYKPTDTAPAIAAK